MLARGVGVAMMCNDETGARRNSQHSQWIKPAFHLVGTFCHWASWEYLSWRAPAVLGLASGYYKDPPRWALQTGQRKHRVRITLESMLSQRHRAVCAIWGSSIPLTSTLPVICVLWRKCQGQRPEHRQPQQRHCPSHEWKKRHLFCTWTQGFSNNKASCVTPFKLH